MNEWLLRRWKIFRLYHKYYSRTGLYKFVWRQAFKVAITIASIILLFFILERFVLADLDVFFRNYVRGLKWQNVLLVFFASESFLGLIPPDFFIIWSWQFDNQFLMLTYLAIISYLGGIIAYGIGGLLYKIPRIQGYVNRKLAEHFITIKRWGGAIIMVAALFPLPYATVSMVAGIMKYPLSMFLILGTTRLLRFYLYAMIIFQFVRL